MLFIKSSAFDVTGHGIPRTDMSVSETRRTYIVFRWVRVTVVVSRSTAGSITASQRELSQLSFLYKLYIYAHVRDMAAPVHVGDGRATVVTRSTCKF